MGTILGALAEAIGLGWLFPSADYRPAYRRPHAIFRAAGAILWVAVIAGLLWWYAQVVDQMDQYIQRLGR